MYFYFYNFIFGNISDYTQEHRSQLSYCSLCSLYEQKIQMYFGYPETCPHDQKKRYTDEQI